MQRWATTNALTESGAPDPHVFQLGGGPELPTQRAASENEISAAELAAVVPPPRVMAATPAPAVTHKSAPTTDAPLNTATVLRQLKARLRVVEREIKTRKTLEAEREQIQRLIAAAKNERSNLRAIRATG